MGPGLWLLWRRGRGLLVCGHNGGGGGLYVLIPGVGWSLECPCWPLRAPESDSAGFQVWCVGLLGFLKRSTSIVERVGGIEYVGAGGGLGWAGGK